jgi:hypothetical protein
LQVFLVILSLLFNVLRFEEGYVSFVGIFWEKTRSFKTFIWTNCKKEERGQPNSQMYFTPSISIIFGIITKSGKLSGVSFVCSISDLTLVTWNYFLQQKW